MSDVERPLSALRVVDLSTEIAGPYCTKLLADAGADVIKVEDGAAPDPLRRWTASGTAIRRGADGALFQYLNASKRGLAVDLDTEAGRRAILDLAATAGLVVDSFPPGTMQRHRLALEDLQVRNPALSLVSITPWGQTGPWATRPATEFTLQAAAGSTAYRGLPQRQPMAAGGRFGEWITATFAAVGAVSAWVSARRSGRGQLVDVSMFEAIVLGMTLYHDLDGQWVEGPLASAVEIPSIEPARDGWVGLATVTGQQWKDFCALIEREDLGEDPRFLNGTLRMQHVGFLHEIIHAWTREHTIDEIVELASAMRIPVSPIGDGRTLPRFDHVVARAVYVAHPGGFLQPRPPYRLGDASPRPPGPAPAIGEHTEEILAALGTRPPAAPRGGDAPAPPLGGLRVIDLTAFWAGPIATCYLASMGADVVKVESVQRPDGMRFAGTIGPHTQPMWEWCPVFAGANTGKRGVTLCLDREEGIALLHRLAATADVLVENYSPRVLENFGITWDALHALNPRLIMVRMPAFGLDGPWRDRTGFAMTIEQVSGLAWITGYADMPLVLRGACDPVGGMHAVFALYLALEERSRTGCGQLVEVPLVECALNVAAEQVIEHSAYGTLLCRDENRGPYAAPQGLYRCAAGGAYIALAVTTDAQWSALRTLLGAPRWARDDVLGTAAGRRAHHDAIDRGIHAWLADREAAVVVEELCAAGIPAACAVNAHDLMPNPQLEHREFFQTMHHPITGSTRYPGFPMRFSALGTRLHRRPPPTLGQHNDEVLGGELGLSADRLRELRDGKIIGERPSFM